MAVDQFWLTTERLALRRFTCDDLEWFAELYGDPDVTRYLGGPRDRRASEDLLNRRILRYYDNHPGLGIWMTVDRASGRPFGFHLLNHIQGERFIQVGFTLAKSAWGRGFGTEMAFALLGYAFLTLRLTQVVAIASLGNHASQHVLQKIGLRRRGERAFAHPAYAAEGPMAWFERDASEWLVERGPEWQAQGLVIRPVAAPLEP